MWFEAIAAWPLLPWRGIEVIVRLSPSGSLSLARTLIVTGPLPWMTVGKSLIAAGAWSTPMTVIVNIWTALVSAPPLAVPPLSWTVTPIVATPFRFAARV